MNTRRFLLDIVINSALGLIGIALIGVIIATAWAIFPDESNRSACADLVMQRTAGQHFSAYTSRDGHRVCAIIEHGRQIISITSPHRRVSHDAQ